MARGVTWHSPFPVRLGDLRVSHTNHECSSWLIHPPLGLACQYSVRNKALQIYPHPLVQHPLIYGEWLITIVARCHTPRPTDRPETATQEPNKT